MKITAINNPGIKAEGLCNGLPYNTELVSSAGAHIHFWVGRERDERQLLKAVLAAQYARDIVKITWSTGEPDGFWTHQDIK